MTDDPYLWLEDVTGDEALAWVRDRNAESAKAISDAEGFTGLRDELLAVLDTTDGEPPYLTPEDEGGTVARYRPASLPSGEGVPFELRFVTGSLTFGVIATILKTRTNSWYDREGRCGHLFST